MLALSNSSAASDQPLAPEEQTRTDGLDRDRGLLAEVGVMGFQLDEVLDAACGKGAARELMDQDVAQEVRPRGYVRTSFVKCETN